MNDFWHMQQNQQQRQHTLMIEAEQSRLASASRTRRVRVVAPVMFRVGGVLLAWGTRLQTRYGELSAPATQMPVASRSL